MRLQENTYDWTFFPYNYFYTWKQDGVDTSGNPIWVPSIAIANSQPDVSTTFYFNCHLNNKIKDLFFKIAMIFMSSKIENVQKIQHNTQKYLKILSLLLT